MVEIALATMLSARRQVLASTAESLAVLGISVRLLLGKAQVPTAAFLHLQNVIIAMNVVQELLASLLSPMLSGMFLSSQFASV